MLVPVSAVVEPDEGRAKVCDRHIVMNHGKKILDVKREDTSVEELTAAVVEGAAGVELL